MDNTNDRMSSTTKDSGPKFEPQNRDTARIPARSNGFRNLLRIGLVLSAIGAFIVLYKNFGSYLTLERLAAQEQQLRDFQSRAPISSMAIGFALYVVVTGLSIPGATAVTLLSAWYFGFWKGLLLVSFASTTGATLAFLFSRYLLRDSMQRRFGDRLKSFNTALKEEGPFYLFTLRLIPAVPFFVINIVMGLTPIATRTFWWVSQLGMFPATAVFVYAGASAPSLQELAERGVESILTPQMIIAFVALGLFPIAAKTILRRIRRTSTEAHTS